MAGGKIGGILISLGLDSAQFTTGLKKAESNLASFGKTAAIGLAAVATAAVAASSALGLAVKGAIDHADALSKSAQKAGVTVEALSRLEYAAKLSDVSLEGLTSGLAKLAKAMSDATISKTSTAAIAFKALGVSVTDATGKLRPTEVVFNEVADKLAQLEDGSTKTALAMQIFGKSGTELIPLLNSGAAGLKQMADEADRTGNTLSGRTAVAAEKFNDTLTRVGLILQGVVNKVMEAALPALQALAETLASPEFGNAAQKLATNVLPILDAIAQAAIRAANAFDFLKNGSKEFQYAKGRTQALNDLRSRSTNIEDRTVDPASFYAGILNPGGGLVQGTPAAATKPITFAPPSLSGGGSTSGDSPIVKGLKATGAALDDVQQKAQRFADTAASAFSNFADAVLSGTNPLQAMSDLLGDIGKQLLNAGIQTLFRSLFAGAGGGSLFSLPGFAAGTMSAPAGLAWVGENGPELVNFRGGESVLSAPQSAALAGGPQINISITGSRQDAAEIARQVGRTLPDAIAAYNRNPRRRT
jgi:phage-related tail protein